MSWALLAAGGAYAVHLLYDWDWNIPAVTLPALMCIGVLAGAGSLRANRACAPTELLRAPASLGTRALALTAATVWMCLFTVSSVLPSLAAITANTALIEGSSSAPAVIAEAASKASLAASLDPFSDSGLRAEASIALHRGQLPRARYDLERAVGRQPSDELAWNELATVDGFLGDRTGARQAARRVVALDPRGPAAQPLIRSGPVGSRP